MDNTKTEVMQAPHKTSIKKRPQKTSQSSSNTSKTSSSPPPPTSQSSSQQQSLSFSGRWLRCGFRAVPTSAKQGRFFHPDIYAQASHHRLQGGRCSLTNGGGILARLSQTQLTCRKLGYQHTQGSHDMYEDKKTYL